MLNLKILSFFSSLLSLFFLSSHASAENIGQAVPWGLNLREPFSELMTEMVIFHDGLLWLITIISLFVLVLLGRVVVKFNKKANPKPTKTTHNTVLEIAWTAIPVLILVVLV